MSNMSMLAESTESVLMLHVAAMLARMLAIGTAMAHLVILVL